MGEALKVGVVMPLAQLKGGSEMMLLHLMQQGRDQGVEWQVLFFEEGPLVAEIQRLGVPAEVVRAGRMRELHRVWKTASHIADRARDENWNLIVGWMAAAHLYGGLAGMMAKKPTLWYQLGTGFANSPLERTVVRIPTRLIMCCSEMVAREQGGMPPHRPTRVVYPGVELERFDPAQLPSPEEARRKLGLPLDRPIIGITGRLQRWKGQHTVIEAMPKVREKYPDALLVLVGGEHADEPDYPKYLEERIAALNLSEQVRMVGLQRNVQEWVQAMDVVIHASQQEPFGIVIIEGMALGKPVIATNTGGPVEIITPEKHGLLTPWEDAGALADAILRYLGDRGLRERVGKAAMVRAQDFSTRRYAENIIACCREAVQSDPLNGHGK
ncbi:MAG: hypothetical protein OHK0029_02720 [Armatimonadaceae bacterium]